MLSRLSQTNDWPLISRLQCEVTSWIANSHHPVVWMRHQTPHSVLIFIYFFITFILNVEVFAGSIILRRHDYWNNSTYLSVLFWCCCCSIAQFSHHQGPKSYLKVLSLKRCLLSGIYWFPAPNQNSVFT